MSGRRILSDSRVVNAALILIGVALSLAGAEVFSHSHWATIILVFAAIVFLGAGVLRVAHTLPPDSTPWG
jgi:hypothetical protein